MNIAFTTILLFLILAPGFIARVAYHASKLSISNPNKNIVNELTFSIIPALIFQVSAIAIVNNLTSYSIDFKAIGNLLLGVTSDGIIEENFKVIEAHKYAIFFYNLIVFSMAYLLGLFVRIIIRKWKLDRKIRFLRFSNKWHYIFSGECLDFPDVPDEFEDITDKVLNVLCKVNGNSVLYTGEFFNYYIDSNGNLEAIHLKYPIRRMLASDFEEDIGKKYYEIQSRYLVIPATDIININFRYFNVEELDESEITEEIRSKAINLA